MNNLPPDPEQQNDDRAKWAEVGLAAFQSYTNSDDEDAMSDLLCDLMHLCDRREKFPRFEVQLLRAQGNYEAETMPCD